MKEPKTIPRLGPKLHAGGDGAETVPERVRGFQPSSFKRIHSTAAGHKSQAGEEE